MTLEALDYLARYLGGVPGRKNLIWFASSFPVTVFPNYGQMETLNHLHVPADEIKKTADLLTVSKVAVYPIGAAGMMNDHWMEADGAADTGRAIWQREMHDMLDGFTRAGSGHPGGTLSLAEVMSGTIARSTADG